MPLESVHMSGSRGNFRGSKKYLVIFLDSPCGEKIPLVDVGLAAVVPTGVDDVVGLLHVARLRHAVVWDTRLVDE